MGIFRKLNIKVVVISFLFAATFWFFRAMNNFYDHTVHYGLKIDYDNEDWIQPTSFSKEVPVNVSGKGWILLGQTFGFYPNVIVLKLNELPSKSYALAPALYPIIANKIKDVRVNYIAKDTIKFNIESLVSKEVPITILSARIDENYKLGKKITFSPETIELTGARSTLDTIKSIDLNTDNINPEEALPQFISLDEFLPDSVTANVPQIEIDGEIIEILSNNFAIVSNIISNGDTLNYQFTINGLYENTFTEDSVNDILEKKFYIIREEGVLIPSFKQLPEGILRTEISPSQIVLKNDSKE